MAGRCPVLIISVHCDYLSLTDCRNTFTVGIFYALPAFQLVFSEQRVSVTLESSDHLVCCALEYVYLERESTECCECVWLLL